MTSSIEYIQDYILETMRAEFAQDVIEQGILDVKTVKRNELNQLYPIYAVQFGDLQAEGAKNMAKVKGDDYRLPVYIQCIAPSPDIARKLHNRLLSLLIGLKVPYGGEMRKRPGGSMWPLVNSDGSVEAYMFPSSYSVQVQFIDMV